MNAKDLLKNAAQATLRGRSYEWVTNLYHEAAFTFDQLHWRYGRSTVENRRRLRRLRGAFAGRRCFVIANGPSLARTDLTQIAAEVTIGSNGLFLLFERMGYLPTFYTVVDWLIAEGRAKEINGIRGATKVFPRALAYCLRPDEDTVYVNHIYPNIGGNFRRAPRQSQLRRPPKFSTRFDRITYPGWTVTYFNLQLAHYVGCREIYLVGCDHHFELPSGFDPEHDHEILSTGPDVNHFDPSYYGPGHRWHAPRLDLMDGAYVVAREFAERKGVRIFNATVGGKLEIFPRVRFEEVVSRTYGAA